jgi:hypothetical protein
VLAVLAVLDLLVPDASVMVLLMLEDLRLEALTKMLFLHSLQGSPHWVCRMLCKLFLGYRIESISWIRQHMTKRGMKS